MTLWDEAAVDRAARVFCRITMEDWSVKPPGRDWTEEEVASAVEADWSSFTGEAELILNAAISPELRELMQAAQRHEKAQGTKDYWPSFANLEEAAFAYAKAVKG